MSTILVVNSGSSSIKYQLIDMLTENVLGKGLIERIGLEGGIVNHTVNGEKHSFSQRIDDHVAGFEAMIRACAEFGPNLEQASISAVGHRAVHGGTKFITSGVISDEVIEEMESLIPLAPLHNPANILGIKAARIAFPNVPHVAVFDTAFHQTMPAAAYTYAIDRSVAQTHSIRRYGFHGTSHKYVCELAADYLARPLEDVNTIVLHIGNGASVCAVRGGKSVETSMGLTPLEGLVMGTRSGDLDPGIIFHLARQAGMTTDEIDTLLNRKSGLVGLFGSSDMRDVMGGVDQGDEAAELALDVYCHRLKHYVGAYYAQLGRLDCIVFTAGVGENVPEVRTRTLSNLEHLGIHLDNDLNSRPGTSIRAISTATSPVTVLVVPTNEELEIARQTLDAVS